MSEPISDRTIVESIYAHPHDLNGREILYMQLALRSTIGTINGLLADDYIDKDRRTAEQNADQIKWQFWASYLSWWGLRADAEGLLHSVEGKGGSHD